MTQRGYEIRIKHTDTDSSAMKRMSQPLLVPIDAVKENATILSKRVFRNESMLLKGPIADKRVVERCLFRQRVFCEIWTDSAIRGPIGTPWTVDQQQKRQFYLIREFSEPKATPFGKWIAKAKSHRILLDDRLLDTAIEAFLHIFRRFVLGINDRSGTAALSHVLVAPDLSLIGISISDDGKREQETIDHMSDHHTVLSLLGGEKWSLEARKTLKIVCGGMNRFKMSHQLDLMTDRDRWNQVYNLANQHEMRSQIDVLEMQKRLFALRRAFQRNAIVN